MDLVIKSEPDISYDSDTLSCEFLDEKPDVRNIAASSKTIQKGLNGTDVECKPSEIDDGEGAVGNKGKEFNHRFRKILLNAFKQEGCSLETMNKYIAIYNFDADAAMEFFDNISKDAEDYVYQECDSLSFNNITEWLKYFKASGRDQQCNYEAAFVLNAIANNELLPKPKVIEGINLVAIYKFLSNSLMGLPQGNLDAISAKFLSDEFQNLIDEANTDEADDDVRSMKRNIEKFIHTNGEQSYDLDPLNTNTKELNQYYSNVKQEENLK